MLYKTVHCVKLGRIRQNWVNGFYEVEMSLFVACQECVTWHCAEWDAEGRGVEPQWKCSRCRRQPSARRLLTNCCQYFITWPQWQWLLSHYDVSLLESVFELTNLRYLVVLRTITTTTTTWPWLWPWPWFSLWLCVHWCPSRTIASASPQNKFLVMALSGRPGKGRPRGEWDEEEGQGNGEKLG